MHGTAAFMVLTLLTRSQVNPSVREREYLKPRNVDAATAVTGDSAQTPDDGCGKEKS